MLVHELKNYWKGVLRKKQLRILVPGTVAVGPTRWTSQKAENAISNRILRVCLDTIYFAKNWKYCSKIIFKCVNSTVEPMNSAWTVYFVSSTVNPCAWTVRLLFIRTGKKKQKEKKNNNMQKTQTWI